MLHELAQQIQQSGRPVAVLAPQRQQVVDMEKAGFPPPATVASFLTKAELPERAVIVVDEAGQIGGRQMLALLRLAKERKYARRPFWRHPAARCGGSIGRVARHGAF